MATPAQNESISKDLNASLKKIFGLKALRPGQKQVIQSVLNGHDTLAVMPTGAGKSLCYQLPALQLPGMTIVVSPLISLMKDQSDKLTEAGVAAAVLNSALSAADERQALADIAAGDTRILFVTPERLANADFIAMLTEDGMPEIPLVVIDEAHCISQWGHDFRPAFVEIAHSIRALARPPLLALTATATPAVIADIVHELGMKHANVINTGVYRENLRFAVEQMTNPRAKRTRLVELANEIEGAGIVYCATVAECDAAHAALVEAGVEAERYHGKLAASQRSDAQDAFMQDRVRVMVATNAFGMGIDKPDIRFVIHDQMPGSLEAYYQEAGRAGRDGKPARCILLFELKDKQVQQFFMSGRYPGVETINRTADTLRALARADDKRMVDKRMVDKPVERLRDALPTVGANKLRITLGLLHDIGFLKRTRRGAVKLCDDDAASERIGEAAERYAAMAERDRAVLERMISYAQNAQCRWRLLLDYFAANLNDARALKPLQESTTLVASQPDAHDELDGGTCGTCDNCLHPPTIIESAREERIAQEAAPDKKAPRVWQAGERVRVKRYGEGTVELVSGERVAVTFPDGETRTFIGRYLKPAPK